MRRRPKGRWKLRSLAVIFLLLAACASVEPVSQVQETPVVNDIVQECPECEQVLCKTSSCSEDTGYECVYEDIVPCCGNGICDETEYGQCDDCPVCSSGDCQTAAFDFEAQECIVTNVTPCCGNGLCEEGEEGCEDCPKCDITKECMTSVIDYEKGVCVVEPIVPCCGNGICDRGESCGTCDDCECDDELDLSDFPDFLQDGTLIVVGDLATSQDTLTAAALATSLYTEGVETEANIYSMFEPSDLASHDLIVLGRPCENALWEEYQGIKCGADNYFDPGTAMIKLIEKSGRQIIYVGGYSPDDTEGAADYLMNERLSGTEVEI